MGNPVLLCLAVTSDTSLASLRVPIIHDSAKSKATLQPLWAQLSANCLGFSPP